MSKKFNFVRAGAITMVLALGTSCFMSGTLAKYVTSEGGSDSARVAKFGVGITANGSTFAKEYNTDDDAFTVAKSVISSNDDNVVAPGTSGEMVSMKLTGVPEVAVEVTYTAAFDLNDNWKDAGGNYYCPLVITVGTTEIEGLNYDNKGDFEEAVETAISNYSRQYEANTNLSLKGDDSLAVSWKWEFETGETDEEKAANDVKDTYLGDQAAAGTPATVILSVTTTVTQID